MNRYVTREEQERLGLIKVSDRNGTRYVPAQFSQDTSLTGNEQTVLSQAVQAAGDIMGHRQMSHLARSEDTAITHAVGGIIASVPYVLIAAGITGALLLIGFLLMGGDGRYYLLFWFVVWGTVSLYFIHKNREQSLQHSSAGIALEEIASREEVAKFTVNRFVEMLEKKWGINS